MTFRRRALGAGLSLMVAACCQSQSAGGDAPSPIEAPPKMPLPPPTTPATLTVPTAAPPRPAPPSAPGSRPSEEAVVEALTEAIPVGKEIIRAAVKPLLDTEVISPQEEMQIGDQVHQEYVHRLGAKLDSNTRDVAYLNAVGQAVVRGVRRKEIRYRFHVIESNTVNAFAIAGGHVYFYRGLLDKVLSSEAQMAFVLGHESGHVDAEHGVDFYKPIKAASQLRLPLPVDVRKLIGSVASQMLTFAYVESQETEADRLGTGFAFQANYEPLEGAAVQRKFMALEGPTEADPITGLLIAFTRSHPPSAKRAAAITAQAEALKKESPGKKLYVGQINYQRRSPITSATFE